MKYGGLLMITSKQCWAVFTLRGSGGTWEWLSGEQTGADACTVTSPWSKGEGQNSACACTSTLCSYSKTVISSQTWVIHVLAFVI